MHKRTAYDGRSALFTRRGALGAIGGSSLASHTVAPRIFGTRPTWSALATAYTVPDWFRDAKFGIWAHWGPQCVPEYGDWYGRQMYQQGNTFYDHHLKHYGHPADTGFIDIIGKWKAENWDPEHLIGLYKAAGAKYFVALANHHDNLDNFDSTHHQWNTLRVGPKRDIVGTWEKIVRRAGLRFGVSNHSAHAWHWWQTGYGYDAEGPRAGERYDAFRLRKSDGAGKFWQGLDPQELYTGPSLAPPDGIASIAALQAWHDSHSGKWLEDAPQNPRHATRWLLRQKDLVEKYRPDLVYLDDTGLPFGNLGLEALRQYHEQATRWHGTPDVVMTAKKLSDAQQAALVDDVERGFSDTLRERPWQTCTCIGDWHYNRARYEQKGYVPAEQVIQRLCDVVSKNGNLLLSIPVRGDGSIDSEEENIVAGITAWIKRNGDAAIFGSRPWLVFGEGPTEAGGGAFGEGKVRFCSGDVRYTVNRGALHAAFLVPPKGPVTLAALPRDAVVERVTLLGGGPLRYTRDAAGLKLTLEGADTVVPVVRIDGRGIV